MVREPKSEPYRDRQQRLQERLAALDAERASLAAEIAALPATEELAGRIPRRADQEWRVGAEVDPIRGTRGL